MAITHDAAYYAGLSDADLASTYIATLNAYRRCGNVHDRGTEYKRLVTMASVAREGGKEEIINEVVKLSRKRPNNAHGTSGAASPQIG